MAQKQKPSADWKEKLAAYIEAHPGVTLASIGRWAGGAKLNPDEVRAEAQRLGVSGELVRPASARKPKAEAKKSVARVAEVAAARRREEARSQARIDAVERGLDPVAVARAAATLRPLSSEGRRLAMALAEALEGAA